MARESIFFSFFMPVCIILLIFQYPVYDTLATSPPFIRHVIDNNFDYWNVIEPRRQAIPKNDPYLSSFASLESVSYSSDGQFLNATLFLSKPFEQNPVMHIPSYVMWIDIDNNNRTGIGRADYAVVVSWNNDTDSWKRFVMELSHDNGRILEQNENHSGFYNENNSKENFDGLFNVTKNFVNLYINLEDLNFPNNTYNVGFAIFETIGGEKEMSMYDTTTWIPIPPPKFDVSLSPSSIELRPNELKTVKLTVNSDTTLQPRVDFGLPENKAKDIASLTVFPNATILPVNGRISSDINIRASENAQEGSFSIPINLNISFQYVGNKGDPGLVLDNSYDLPITVLPKITLWDIIINSLNTLSAPMQQLAQIVSALGALGISGALFTLFKKLHKNKDKIFWNAYDSLEARSETHEVDAQELIDSLAEKQFPKQDVEQIIAKMLEKKRLQRVETSHLKKTTE